MNYKQTLIYFVLSLFDNLMNGLGCDEDWFNFNEEKCIKIVLNPMNMAESIQECERMDATLLTIHSREEQLFITLNLFDKELPLYIGLRRKMSSNGFINEFEWDGGSQLYYQNWGTQSYNTHAGCVALQNLATNTGKWYTEDCVRRLYFICQKEFVSGTNYTRNAFNLSNHSNGYFSYRNSSYKPYNMSLSWNDAESRCQKDHPNSHLVSITDGPEHVFVQLLALKTLLETKFWIGLKQNYFSSQVEYQWNDGWPFIYASWDVNQIKSYSNGKCIVEDEVSVIWRKDIHCSEKNEFICKINTKESPGEQQYDNFNCPESNDKGIKGKWNNLYTRSKYCYWIDAVTKSNWKDAKNECNQRNSTLVVITSKTESDLIHNFISGISVIKWFWIGLKRNKLNNFEWEDGTQSNYTNWEDGHPKNDSNFDCVVMNENMLWETIKCSSKFYFLCSIRKKNIINNPKNQSLFVGINVSIISLLIIIILVSCIIIYRYKTKLRKKQIDKSNDDDFCEEYTYDTIDDVCDNHYYSVDYDQINAMQLYEFNLRNSIYESN